MATSIISSNKATEPWTNILTYAYGVGESKALTGSERPYYVLGFVVDPLSPSLRGCVLVPKIHLLAMWLPVVADKKPYYVRVEWNMNTNTFTYLDMYDPTGEISQLYLTGLWI